MFNVGDEVRIKSDLKIGEQYNGCYFVSQMKSYRGKRGIITCVLHDNYQTRRYKLDIDKDYHFSNDMLDSIENSYSNLPYKVGDRVRIIDEMPDDLCGISIHTWAQLLGKSGKITVERASTDSYMISIPEVSVSFWFPSKYFKKESTSTSKNSTENISKLIECVPEIELSYCKKQIYTI